MPKRISRVHGLRTRWRRSAVSRIDEGTTALGVCGLLLTGTLAACGMPEPSAAPAARQTAPFELASRSRVNAPEIGLPRPESPKAEPAGDDGWQAFTTFPALVSPELGKVFEGWRREADPAHWFFSHPEAPPKGFKLWPARVAAFPGRQVAAKVLVHRFAGDRDTPHRSLLDARVPGCGADLIDRSGARCPSVSYPGRELTEAQRAELVEIANTPNDAPRTLTNGYNFTVGFLFFDAAEGPFAQLLVDASVTKLWLSPRVGKQALDTMMPARRQRLRALLGQLELLPPESDELHERLGAQRALDGELFRLRYLPAHSGVPPELSMNALDDQQKLALCFWYARSWTRPRSGGGFACEDGSRLLGQEVAHCMSALPTCDISVAEAEQCMRRQRVDACYERPESASCLPRRGCLWGMARTPPPASSGECDVWQREWMVALTPHPSAKARARLLEQVLQKASAPPLCRASMIYARVPGLELQAMFGPHLALQGVPGAGNSSRICGWFAQLTPAKFVPAAFSASARRVEIVTDEKLELIREFHECK